MRNFYRALAALAFVLLPSIAWADAVEECIRNNCNFDMGTCDFDPNDPGRRAGCEEKRNQCAADCRYNPGTSGGRPALYGAIAYSPSAHASGMTRDYGDQGSAEQAALEACEQRAQAGDCRVVIWFSNNCGALATATDGTYGGGYSSNREGAQASAMFYCRKSGGRDCVVRGTVCTGL